MLTDKEKENIRESLKELGTLTLYNIRTSEYAEGTWEDITEISSDANGVLILGDGIDEYMLIQGDEE